MKKWFFRFAALTTAFLLTSATAASATEYIRPRAKVEKRFLLEGRHGGLPLQKQVFCELNPFNRRGEPLCSPS
jgi:hypothetical protein